VTSEGGGLVGVRRSQWSVAGSQIHGAVVAGPALGCVVLHGQPLVRSAAPMPSSSARTRSVSASRGIGCSVGELPGLDETLAGGGEMLAGVADVGAGLLVEGASGGRAAAERWEVPVAALGEVVTVGVPAVLGAANAACTAVLNSCVAISAAAASTCCSGAGEVPDNSASKWLPGTALRSRFLPGGSTSTKT